jgi:hypothetical protein
MLFYFFILPPLLNGFRLLRFLFQAHASVKLAYNVLALGAVADFGAQNCQYTTKADAR